MVFVVGGEVLSTIQKILLTICTSKQVSEELCHVFLKASSKNDGVFWLKLNGISLTL